MKFSELKRIMSDFNDKYGIKRKVDYKYNDSNELIQVKAKVVIRKGYFKPEYDELFYREYAFNNYNKALTSDDLGYSIFAYNSNDMTSLRLEEMNNDDFESCEIIEVIL